MNLYLGTTKAPVWNEGQYYQKRTMISFQTEATHLKVCLRVSHYMPYVVRTGG